MDLIGEFMNCLSLIQVINLLSFQKCFGGRSEGEYPEATPKNIAQAKEFARQIVEYPAKRFHASTKGRMS